LIEPPLPAASRPFEDHGDALAAVADPGVELHQFDLKRLKLILVISLFHAFVIGIGGVEHRVLPGRADGFPHAFGGLVLEETGDGAVEGQRRRFRVGFLGGFRHDGRPSCSCYGV
jgi:hypothetical protein